MAFQPRGRGRGRGRGRSGGGQDFQQYSNDGDMNMAEDRPFVPRGRGRGGFQGNQFQQHQNQQHHQNSRPFDNEGDQSMQDPNSSRGRGRGRGWAPRGQNHYQAPHQRDHRDQQDANGLSPENPAVQLMKDFLGRRYDASNKLLNLSAIATDETVRQAGMFATESTQKKFFPALMVVCDDMLGSQEAKEEAIQSVTLSNNNLENTHAVYTLCWQLNHIKNLDLSNNKFATLDALKPWKGRFKNLEHIIVDPFPGLGWEEELTSWYPKLKIINNTQVRPATTNNNNNNGPAAAMNNNAPPTGPSNMQQQPGFAQAQAPGQVFGAAAPVDPEQQRKEEILLFVQQQTNLKRDYALQCLEAAQWNIDQASILFQQSQPTLPPEAYN